MSLQKTENAKAGGDWWELNLVNKPDSDMAMRRIYAWYRQEMLDRPPIRFTAHNAEYTAPHLLAGRSWPDLKARWFDAEFQVDFFIESIQGAIFSCRNLSRLLAQPRPRNLCRLPRQRVGLQGSNVLLRSTGERMGRHGEDPFRHARIAYFRKIEEMTQLALEKCNGRFLVGYTDLHGGVDCAAAWRDPQQLCMDLICSPEEVKKLIALAARELPAGVRSL